VVRNSQPLVFLQGFPKLRHVLYQVFLLARFQYHRIQPPGRVALHTIPPVVIGIQIHLVSHVGTHHVVHKILQDSAFSPNRSEGE
jgi:hypothetical protein